MKEIYPARPESDEFFIIDDGTVTGVDAAKVDELADLAQKRLEEKSDPSD